MEDQYDFFISFAGADQSVAENLYSYLLRGYGRFSNRIFFSPQSIGLGQSWAREFANALKKSRVVVVLLTSASAEAYFQLAEVTAALAVLRSNPSGHRIVPIVFDDDNFLWDILAPLLGELPVLTNAEATIETVADRLLAEFSTLRTIREELPHSDAWSETTVLSAVANGTLQTLEMIRPSQMAGNRMAEFHTQAIIGQIREILVQKSDYLPLQKFCESLTIRLRQTSVTEVAEWVHNELHDLRRDMADLGRIGAGTIGANDAILLYSFSKAVLAVISHWLSNHQEEVVTIFLCECRPKSANKPYAESLHWAEQLPRNRCRLRFIPDADAARVLMAGQVTKVFMGVHRLRRPSPRRALFDNTAGSLALAQAAASANVPLFVFARTAKTLTDIHSFKVEPPDGRDTRELRLLDEDRDALRQRHPDAVDLPSEPDAVDSADYPFFVVTEHGQDYCGDFDLQKMNQVAVDEWSHVALKRTMGWESASAERKVLQTLAARETAVFKVPAYEESHGGSRSLPWAPVRMRAIKGIRVHDLLVTLRDVAARPPDARVAASATSLATKLREWALAAVDVWQSSTTQDALLHSLGGMVRPYPFDTRFAEALDFVAGQHPSICGSDVRADCSKVAARLVEAANTGVLFRDATLKNQVFALDDDLGTASARKLQFRRPADVQWRDADVVVRLLQETGEARNWEILADRIWQLDFESAFLLTNRTDDYIHVLGLDVIDWTLDDIAGEVARRADCPPELTYLTALFRGFRGWVRRVGYLLRRPDVYATRYRYERLEHPLELARSAHDALAHLHGWGLAYLGECLEECMRWQTDDLSRRAFALTGAA